MIGIREYDLSQETPEYKVELKNIRRIIKYHKLDVKNRKRIVNYKRIIVANLLRNRYDLTLSNIGSELGGRNHATILHMIKNYNLLSSYSDFQAVESAILTELELGLSFEELFLKCEILEDFKELQSKLKTSFYAGLD